MHKQLQDLVDVFKSDEDLNTSRNQDLNTSRNQDR